MADELSPRCTDAPLPESAQPEELDCREPALPEPAQPAQPATLWVHGQCGWPLPDPAQPVLYVQPPPQPLLGLAERILRSACPPPPPLLDLLELITRSIYQPPPPVPDLLEQITRSIYQPPPPVPDPPFVLSVYPQPAPAPEPSFVQPAQYMLALPLPLPAPAPIAILTRQKIKESIVAMLSSMTPAEVKATDTNELVRRWQGMVGEPVTSGKKRNDGPFSYRRRVVRGFKRQP